jgi:hypothetical protein
MKTILLLAATLLGNLAHATIFTVSNNPSVPAQYTDLTSAQTVAEAGDTIQIAGSSNTYNYFTCTKQLHFVGPGWGGPGLAATLFSTTFNAGSNGSTMEGLALQSSCYINASNITIHDCYIYQLYTYATASNLLVRNCVGLFLLENIGAASGTVFANCLFNYKDTTYDTGNPNVYIDGNNNAMDYPATFTNCTFYKVGFNQLHNIVMQNCVLYSINATNNYYAAAGNVCNNCTFANNLLTCPSCALTEITGNPVLVDNLGNATNQFVSAPQTPNAFAGSSTPLAQMNFSLIASSPGINAGTDGGTVGIQGGAYPFGANSVYGSLSGVVPYVSSFIINNPVIPQGGTLDIQGTSVIPGN